MQQEAMPALGKAKPFQPAERNVQIAKRGEFFRMERAQMDSPVSFARRRSDSELVCSMAKARHWATGPRDRTGTREQRQGSKSDTFQLLEAKEQTLAHQS